MPCPDNKMQNPYQTDSASFLTMPYNLKHPTFKYFANCSSSSQFQFFAVSAKPVNFTQVPQEELKFLGTGMIVAGYPSFSHFFLKDIAPKWEKNVAM